VSETQRDRALVLLVVLAGGAAAAILLAATRWGIGVSYDSVFYLSAADNLLHGLGLSRLGGGGEVIPLTHFPPLYPLTLAIGSWLTSLSTSVVARWLAAILLAVLVVLCGLIVKNFTNSTLAAGATAILVASSPVFFDVDVWVMSEALYLVCLVAGLWLLASYASSGSWRQLLGAALLTGAAYATRYVGAAMLATGLIVIWFASRQPWIARARRLLVYAVVSGVPVAAWMIRNLLLTGLTTNRTLLFHPIGRAKLSEAAHALAGFVLPQEMAFGLRLGLTVLAIVGLGLYWLRIWLRSNCPLPHGWDTNSKLAIILALHAVLYGCLLLVSLSFLDASTRLDDRILSPLWLLAILLAGAGLGRWLSGPRRPSWVNWTMAVVCLGLAASGGARLWNQAGAAYIRGLGFNSRSWVTSPAVAWVEALPSSASLTSNEAFPLYYLTGRPVYWAPEAIDPVKGGPRADYPEELAAMRTRLESTDAFLVIFHPDSLRVEMPPLTELTQGLTPVVETRDARVYAGR